jgi:hypothetical protein
VKLHLQSPCMPSLHGQGQLLLELHFMPDVCGLARVGSTPAPSGYYRGADKSLARPTSLSILFSVQGTGGSPTGPYPHNRVGDQDTGSPGRPVSPVLQVPGEPFPSWSG